MDFEELNTLVPETQDVTKEQKSDFSVSTMFEKKIESPLLREYRKDAPKLQEPKQAKKGKFKLFGKKDEPQQTTGEQQSEEQPQKTEIQRELDELNDPDMTADFASMIVNGFDTLIDVVTPLISDYQIQEDSEAKKKLKNLEKITTALFLKHNVRFNEWHMLFVALLSYGAGKKKNLKKKPSKSLELKDNSKKDIIAKETPIRQMKQEKSLEKSIDKSVSDSAQRQTNETRKGLIYTM